MPATSNLTPIQETSYPTSTKAPPSVSVPSPTFSVQPLITPTTWPPLTLTPIPTFTLLPEGERYQETTPPIILGYLEGQSLRFTCLNTHKCIPDIDLSQWLAQEGIINKDFLLHSVHYVDESTIYVVIKLQQSNGEKQTLVFQFNPKRNLVNYVALRDGAPGPYAALVIEDRLVILSGKLAVSNTPVGSSNVREDVHVEPLLYVIGESQTVDIIALDQKDQNCQYPTGVIIGGTDGKVILPQYETQKREGKYYTKACIIDTIAGELVSVHIIESTESWIASISPDLNTVFTVDRVLESSEYRDKLKRYDAKSGNVKSINTWKCINNHGGYPLYQQYRGFLFSSSGCSGPWDPSIDCYGKTTLIRMNDLNPILCRSRRAHIKLVPFGNYFLMDNTTGTITLITPEGEAVGQFLLRPELLAKDYHLMEYRKQHVQ